MGIYSGARVARLTSPLTLAAPLKLRSMLKPEKQPGASPAGPASSDYMHPLFGSIKLAKYTDVTQPGGALKEDFQARLSPEFMDQGMSTLRDRALTGQSPYMDARMNQAKMANMYAMEDAAKNRARALYRPGNLNQATQGLRAASSLPAMQQGASNIYGLLGEQVSRGPERLRQQAAREIATLQPQQFNIQQAMAERAGRDETGFRNFEEQMKAYAGRQQAQAQLDTRGSGGLWGMLFG